MPMESQNPIEPKVKSSGGSAVVFMFILFVLASIAAGYFYYKNLKLEQDPSKVSEARIASVVEKVGKLILLPEGETPTVAEVNDPSKLAGQPFFERAKIGDQVLLYAGARKVILYDPKADIIMDVAILNIGK